MKILLLCDVPPGDNFSGAIALQQLCKFLPKSALCCFSVRNPALVQGVLGPALEGVPIEIVAKPRENGFRPLPGRAGSVTAYAYDRFVSQRRLPDLVDRAVEFGRRHKIDRVWAVLQGQTIIRIAPLIAQKLGVPLYSQVWDPVGWWIRAHGIDARTGAGIQVAYDAALSGSEKIGAASIPMAEEYSRRYNVPSFPLMHGLPDTFGCEPIDHLRSGDQFRIGVAGQLYASEEWACLLRTLGHMNWKFMGRDVVIRYLGPHLYLAATQKMNVEYWGWRSQDEAAEILGSCDLLYCPYWFSPVFREEAMYSFPSKLSLYLSCARPVVFHGPEYAAPARFLKEMNAGILCTEFSEEALWEQFRRLAETPQLFGELSRKARAAFQEHLSNSSLRGHLYDFLDVPNSSPLREEFMAASMDGSNA
jgi:hypothetical protein